MKTNENSETRAWARGLFEGAVSVAIGALGMLSLVLICCEPADDGSPFTWEFFAVKAAGLALLVGTNAIFRKAGRTRR